MWIWWFTCRVLITCICPPTVNRHEHNFHSNRCGTYSVTHLPIIKQETLHYFIPVYHHLSSGIPSIEGEWINSWEEGRIQVSMGYISPKELKVVLNSLNVAKWMLNSCLDFWQCSFLFTENGFGLCVPENILLQQVNYLAYFLYGKFSRFFFMATYL